MLNYLNIAAGIENSGDLCSESSPILKIVGIVVLGIQIVVPIILIVTGMIQLARAVNEKDEGEIKKAQGVLIKKAIVAVLVFLVVPIVGILMSLIGNDKYKDCMSCITSPFGDKCEKAVLKSGAKINED